MVFACGIWCLADTSVSDGRASGLEWHKTRDHYHTDASEFRSILFTLRLRVKVQYGEAYKLRKLKHYKQRAPNCKHWNYKNEGKTLFEN